MRAMGAPYALMLLLKQCKAVRKILYSIKRGATSISVLNYNIQILISNRFRVGTAFRILNFPSLLSHHSDSMARWSIFSLCQSFRSLTLFLSLSSETLCFCFRSLKDGVVNSLVSISHPFSCLASIPSTVIGYKIVARQRD